MNAKMKVLIILMGFVSICTWGQVKSNSNLDAYPISLEKGIIPIPGAEGTLAATYQSPQNVPVTVVAWVTTPLESTFEENIEIEEWMTNPFELVSFDEPLAVEFWMTSPFTSIPEKEINTPRDK